MSVTRQEASELIGHDVKMALLGEPYFGGVAMRWGTLRAVTDDGLVVDGYHDCAGIGAGMGGGQHDGVTVGFAEVRKLERDWHVIA